jgi:hypothetical protein
VLLGLLKAHLVFTLPVILLLLAVVVVAVLVEIQLELAVVALEVI